MANMRRTEFIVATLAACVAGAATAKPASGGGASSKAEGGEVPQCDPKTGNYQAVYSAVARRSHDFIVRIKRNGGTSD